MALRTIRLQGDPVLEKKCKEVKEITPKIEELIDDMLETMYEANGVGLAAPQVGILKRIVVIDVQEKRFSFLFIAHDLSMVRFLSDTTGVMKNGKLVAMAPTKELFENPQHPYTQSLLSAIHIPDPLEERKRRLIEYEEPQSLGEGWKELSACHCVRI